MVSSFGNGWGQSRAGPAFRNRLKFVSDAQDTALGADCYGARHTSS